jgi:hypothetical protein
VAIKRRLRLSERPIPSKALLCADAGQLSWLRMSQLSLSSQTQSSSLNLLRIFLAIRRACKSVEVGKRKKNGWEIPGGPARDSRNRRLRPCLAPLRYKKDRQSSVWENRVAIKTRKAPEPLRKESLNDLGFSMIA